MYYNGKGVEQDYEKAAEYYRQAVEMGAEEAEEDLKRLSAEGKISTDYAKVADTGDTAAE